MLLLRIESGEPFCKKPRHRGRKPLRFPTKTEPVPVLQSHMIWLFAEEAPKKDADEPDKPEDEANHDRDHPKLIR